MHDEIEALERSVRMLYHGERGSLAVRDAYTTARMALIRMAAHASWLEGRMADYWRMVEEREE